MVKINTLSKNVVDVIATLAKNDGLVKLLVHNVDNPFDSNLPAIDKSKIANPKSDLCRIYPYPFDPDAQIEDSSFIRVYYNQGEFNENEVIQDMDLFIDIIVAKSLWLINDGNKSMIRPYEIMDRVVDLVGKRSLNNTIKLKFDGWQHLAVNTKFDAIRLYSKYWNIET